MHTVNQLMDTRFAAYAIYGTSSSHPIFIYNSEKTCCTTFHALIMPTKSRSLREGVQKETFWGILKRKTI